MMTLVEKILSEQQEIAEDLRVFLETEKQISVTDIEAIQKQQSEINELIGQIALQNSET